MLESLCMYRLLSVGGALKFHRDEFFDFVEEQPD